ncbi:MAG TPA: ribosomal protein S18-alanine N-acetyltransferase [Candidatus Subteraquimicrobiales bacterium]
MNLRITPMSFRDVEGVYRIERQVFPSPWTKEAFKREIKNENHSVMLAAKNGQEVVGYAGLFFVYDEGHVTNIAVKPELQGRGVGTCLLLELIKAALLKRVTNLMLEVRESNQIALSLYRKFGFEPMGVRKDYYLDTQEDALVLEKEALSSPDNIERLEKIEKELKVRVQWLE